ncbi:hypothetical protein EON81_11175 [bacterium]|nr:MAG: hypothetical protein EON81_11175 [bacterium]
MSAHESNPPVDSGAEVSLQPVFARIWARKVPFLLTVVGVSAAGIAYFSTRPDIWQADSTLLLAQNQMSAGNPLVAMTATSPSGVIRGVLTSRTVMDDINETTGYKGRLSEIYAVKEDVPTGRLMLAASDTSKDMALNIVKSALASLKRVDETTGISLASRRARQLEGAITTKERSLQFAESKLANFVSTMEAPTTGSLSDPTTVTRYIDRQRQLEQQLGESREKIAQYEATALKTGANAASLPTLIPSATALRTKYIDAQNALDLLRVTYGPEAPQVVKAQQEADVYRRQLESEVRKYIQSVNENIDPQLATLQAERVAIQYNLDEVKKKAALAPGEQTRLARMQRDVVTLTTSLAAMRSQYELARQEAEVQAIKYTELDPPMLQPKPINKTVPSVYGVPIFLGLAAGFIAFGRSPKAKPRTGG